MSETLYGTDDGFRRAMADANRMRLRSLGTATCATALVVALTGSLVPAQQSSGKGRLDMVTTPVTPRPSMRAPAADPYVPPATTGSGARAVAGTAPARPVVTAAPERSRERRAPGLPRRHPGPHSTGMSRSVSGFIPNVGCNLEQTGWCFTAEGKLAESPGHVRWLAVDLCGTPSGAARLRFDTSAEVEMAVLDSRGRVLWSWVAEHPPVAQPHEVTYSAGTPCMRWTTKWFERTSDGVAVGPGRYRFVARYLGTAPAGLPASTVEFRL